MAGDWIKMRVDLQTHPKIVRILSATKSDKFRVVGGLHAVWGVFDTHSVDGRLDGYTPETLDHIIGWQGFAQAMIDVGWLACDGAQALVLPDFSEHNGRSGKRRAEDQRRKKDERKSPQTVRNLSDSDADEKLTREEKRRNKDIGADEPRFDPSAELSARGVQPQTIADWLKLRKAQKAPVTETVLAGFISEADKAGMSLERVLSLCCLKGWRGFKAEWAKDEPKDQPAKREWD